MDDITKYNIIADKNNLNKSELSFYQQLESYFVNNNYNVVEKLKNFPKYVPRQDMTRFLVRYELFLMPKVLERFRLVNISRLGAFYFISRLLYPAMIYPEEPNQAHPINKVAIKSQNLMGNELDRYGVQLMIHLRKKR